MKTFVDFKIRGFILLATFFTGLGFGTSAFAQTLLREYQYLVDLSSRTTTRLYQSPFGDVFYRNINDSGQLVGNFGEAPFHAFITGPNGIGMRDLGTLGDNPARSNSSAFAINNSGQVAGFSDSIRDRLQFESHAFITGPDGMGMRSLGTLAGNHPAASSSASGVNEAGQVVGGSVVGASYHAFITGPGGIGMRDLGTLGGTNSRASGINEAGQVVGGSVVGASYHAFITGPGGIGMRDLGTLGGTNSRASGINEAGQVVGGSVVGASYHAFITGPGGIGMRDLGTLGGTNSRASGINEAGQVIGNSLTAQNVWHAFITGPDGTGMKDLGTLGGTSSSAVGISDIGQVAGNADTAGGASHAFVTGADGIGMRDLGTLGGTSSEAYGINEAGQVIGGSLTAENVWRAFITGPEGEGMTDLNSLVDMPTGEVLLQATAINNAGQVLAIGLIPEPEIYALILPGLGLVGFIARQKKAKKPC
ncbi:probable extracellular repeat, HAF family [Nitrosospira multiformis ATCC 25196]|uniref:Probable extracellular repeat, HAF family n=1 Tax=Nitrosospira multiformis (strain ATCC 25196 / NCIMB 11849 / C 71) TaxID=323848 RepID=A0A1H5Y5B3_NITMU|nr:PEP-CTERM sorting domain-containing protein [Nitrosospira multiformis]SEG18887.1 probable extracellular repeat, HAF family [Nitrosospira multiformis ATCC 25196]